MNVRAAFVAVVRTLALATGVIAAGDAVFLGLVEELPWGTDVLGVRTYLLVDPILRIALAGAVFAFVPRWAARVRFASSSASPVAGARLATVGVGILACAQALRSAASAAVAPALARVSGEGWFPSHDSFGWGLAATYLGVAGVGFVGRARIVAFVDRWFRASRPDGGPAA